MANSLCAKRRRQYERQRECSSFPLQGFLLLSKTISLLFLSSTCYAFSLPPNAALIQSRSIIVCYVNVATELLRNDSDNDSDKHRNNGKHLKKQIPSRAERKALERAKKQQQLKNNSTLANKRRKHNYKERQDFLKPDRQPGEGRYNLHYRAISELLTDKSHTVSDIMKAIKRAQNLHDAHDLIALERFLLEQTDSHYAYGFRGSLLARLAVAALHLNQHEMATKALQVRRTEHANSRLPMESAAIIRGLLRVHNVTEALHVLDEELSLPEKLDYSSNSTTESDVNINDLRDRIKHRALALASIASRHFFEDDPHMAVEACSQIASLGSIVRQSATDVSLPWVRLIRGSSQCQSRMRDCTVKVNNKNSNNASRSPKNTSLDKLPCNLVYSVLNAMATFPSENDDSIYETLANSLVRRVVFITGAVDKEGLPEADRGEAAFIGRSNVGKSSLVNMVTNRKSLAFISKRPGKTQQLNFFAVNDKVGKEKEIRYGDIVEGEKDADSFYIVDLPGFGYASVPEQQRKKWLEFMHEYLSERKSLRVVFHLIDSRLGPTVEDTNIMKEVGDYLPKSVSYVVVLTKADKNIKGASTQYSRGKVSFNVMESVRNAMQESGIGNAPVLLTSSETKLGRDDIWRYLRLAAEA